MFGWPAHIKITKSCQSSKLGECYIEVSDFQEKQEALIQSELMFSTLKLSQAGLNRMQSVPAHLVHQSSCYFSDLKYSFYQFFENFAQSVLIMFTLLPPTLLKSTPLNFVSLPQPYQGQYSWMCGHPLKHGQLLRGYILFGPFICQQQ